MSRKPLLLVSVRNADEAQIAIAAGADLIDFKEPRAGSLGAVDDPVLLGALERLSGTATLSVACGELLESDWTQPPSTLRTRVCRGVQFFKVGLAGCAHRGDWPRLWQQFAAQLPSGDQEPVGVAYVDASVAAAPSIDEVLAQTAALGSRTLLLDTWGKTNGGLLDFVTLEELAQLRLRTQAAGQRLVLAGSLDLASMARVLPLCPDVIAVRGAACLGGREGQVDLGKVCRLVELLRRQSFPQRCHANH